VFLNGNTTLSPLHETEVQRHLYKLYYQIPVYHFAQYLLRVCFSAYDLDIFKDMPLASCTSIPFFAWSTIFSV
jgi:hypothetical protein